MSKEVMKLVAEFDKRFTSMNGVDVPEKVSVPRDEWRALRDAIVQSLAQPSPVQDLHFFKQVLSVAIAGLYEHYKGDVLKTFSIRELQEVVDLSESLRPRRVEDIYKQMWVMLATSPAQPAVQGPVRIYDYVWPQRDEHKDDCVYACSYTPGHHLARGELLAVVHPSQLKNAYLQRDDEDTPLNVASLPAAQPAPVPDLTHDQWDEWQNKHGLILERGALDELRSMLYTSPPTQPAPVWRYWKVKDRCVVTGPFTTTSKEEAYGPDCIDATPLTVPAAQPAAPLTAWQPIETAPRDGRWVITFDGETVSPNYYLGSEIEHWAKTPLLVNPTHWMPIPTAPDKGDAVCRL